MESADEPADEADEEMLAEDDRDEDVEEAEAVTLGLRILPPPSPNAASGPLFELALDVNCESLRRDVLCSAGDGGESSTLRLSEAMAVGAEKGSSRPSGSRMRHASQW